MENKKIKKGKNNKRRGGYQMALKKAHLEKLNITREILQDEQGLNFLSLIQKRDNIATKISKIQTVRGDLDRIINLLGDPRSWNIKLNRELEVDKKIEEVREVVNEKNTDLLKDPSVKETIDKFFKWCELSEKRERTQNWVNEQNFERYREPYSMEI